MRCVHTGEVLLVGSLDILYLERDLALKIHQRVARDTEREFTRKKVTKIRSFLKVVYYSFKTKFI